MSMAIRYLGKRKRDGQDRWEVYGGHGEGRYSRTVTGSAAYAQEVNHPSHEQTVTPEERV